MYSIAWYQPARILSIHLIGNVTLEDITALDAAIYDILEQQADPLHVLIDLNSASHLPLKLNQLYRMLENHPEYGTLILFGGSHLTGKLAGWLSRLYTQKVCYATDLSQALHILQEKYPDLDMRVQLSAVS